MAHTAGPPPAARPRPVLGGPAAWAILTVGQFAAVVAVLQRSSLGVAATDALTRLLVYAVLQVPVGVLIDRYGSKRLIVIGSLVMACAQAMFAVAASLPLAFAARVVLGVGDALTFISVMRLVPTWFPPERSSDHHCYGAGQPAGLRRVRCGLRLGARRGRVDAVVPVRRVGQCRHRGTGARADARLAARQAAAGTARPRAHRAVEGVREAWAAPGTRLGFWLGFMTLFTGMTFGVMWGYPTLGQGL